jgi:hypothetical protein
MAQIQSKLHELDEKHFLRNQKTAWLQYLDKLAAWLWQDNEGAARWTLILDDADRLCPKGQGNGDDCARGDCI